MTIPGPQDGQQPPIGLNPVFATDMPVRSRRRPPPRGVIVLAVCIVLFVVLSLMAAAYGIWLRTGPSQTDVQRQCRTAAEQEFRKRSDDLAAANAASGRTVLVALAGIDTLETVKTKAGWDVNYAVRFTLTAALVPQVSSTLSLTCHGTVKDRKVTTSVVNRV